MLGLRRSTEHHLGRERTSSGRNGRSTGLWNQAVEVGAPACRRQHRDFFFKNRGPLHHAVSDSEGLTTQLRSSCRVPPCLATVIAMLGVCRNDPESENVELQYCSSCANRWMTETLQQEALPCVYH